jgi:hypothetical protein
MALLKRSSALPAFAFVVATLVPAACVLHTDGVPDTGGTTSTGSSTSSMMAPCTPGDVETCYDGPVGTANIGLCKSGKHTCNADGTWGDCVGQVLPKTEDCSTPDDEDCDGAAFNPLDSDCACAPGATTDCDTGAMGICGQGKHTCNADGKTFGTCDGAPSPTFDNCLTPNVDEDCDGKVFGCTGNSLWAGVYSTPSSMNEDIVLAVAAVPGGGVVIGGISNAVFTSQQITSSSAFVAKYDNGGTMLWSQNLGASTYAEVRGVAVDGSGNVIVTGDYEGNLQIGGGVTIPGSASPDVFIVKYDKSGTLLWSDYAGDGAEQYATSIAVDGAGNIAVAGSFAGNATFGPSGAQQTLSSAGNFDAFVTIYAPDGKVAWAKRFGDGDNQGVNAIAVTPAGDWVLGGYFGGKIDFGLGSKDAGIGTGNGNADAFVAVLKGDGTELWSKGFGSSPDTQTVLGVAVDPVAGDVWITGRFAGNFDLGGGTLTAIGGDDIFAAKLAGADGNHLFSKGFGDNNDQPGFAIAVDGAGNPLLVGRFRGMFSFGGANLTDADTTNMSPDVFAVKLDPQGKHVWSRRYGDINADVAWGVSYDAKGNAYIGGGWHKTIDFGAAGMKASAGGYDGFVVKLAP